MQSAGAHSCSSYSMSNSGSRSLKKSEILYHFAAKETYLGQKVQAQFLNNVPEAMTFAGKQYQ
jgi:hypothetical protein